MIDAALTLACVAVAMGLPTVWCFGTSHLNTSVALTQGRNWLVLTDVESAIRRTIPWLRNSENFLCYAVAVHVLRR